MVSGPPSRSARNERGGVARRARARVGSTAVRGEGDGYKEIAEALSISIYTARAHLRNIYEKLHVHSKSQAVSKALQAGLLRRR